MDSAYSKLMIVIASCLLASFVRGSDVLFSDLNTNPASLYDNFVSHTIEGADPGPFIAQGSTFVPSASEQLSQLQIALSASAGTRSMVVTLNSDSSGLPGGVLESWTVSGLPLEGGCCALQTLTSNVTIDLFTGTHYWVVVFPGANDTFGGWSLNNTGVTAPRADESSAGGPFSILGANDTVGALAVIGNGVQVTPAVPEPASFGLLGVGLALLGGFHGRARLKRHAD